jgi:BolA protein
MNEEEVIARVKALYPEAVIDIAGENCSFEMYIIDEAFEGMGTLQRQKPILALFKDEIASGKLHALSVKAKTPKEQAGSVGLVQIQL